MTSPRSNPFVGECCEDAALCTDQEYLRQWPDAQHAAQAASRTDQPRAPGRSNPITTNITAQPPSGTRSPMRRLPEYRETTPTIGGIRALPPAASANITPPTFRARTP